MKARMHLAGDGRKRSVPRHGVIHARADRDHRVHRRHQRERHQPGEDSRDLRSEQARRGEGAHRLLPLHILQRSRVEKHEVQHQIQRRDQRGADPQRHGQGARGLAQFLGDVGGRVPAAIGDVDPHQAEGELSRSAAWSHVRVAVTAKCDVFPSPIVNPSTMKASSTRTFAPVKTFCTRATRCTPRMFSTVKTATSPQATACAPPSRMAHSPEPAITGAFSWLRAGKKCPRYSENASAAAAMGAENPAKKEAQPVMNPQVGPKARVR